MTTSPERAGAAPWYCSHESSRAATSTMVAAGLVATAALMAFVGLLVTGDEVSALVAAMVMLVAGANTWSAGRSRSWWRAEPTAGRGSRPRAASAAPAPAPAPERRARPVAAGTAVPAFDDQGHVRQGPGPGELRGVPVAVGAGRVVPAFDDQGHVRQGPRPGELRGVPVAGTSVPEPVAGAPTPPVVHLAPVSTTPARAPQPVRATAPGPAAAAVETSAPSSDGSDDRTASTRAGRTASAPAARPRRRTVAVRPVTRRVAGTRPS